MTKAVVSNNLGMEEYDLNPSNYAAIYARQSSQSDEIHSTKTQIRLAKELAEKNHLIIYDIYEEKKSAAKYLSHARPEFTRLLQDAADNKFKNVIVFKRDRLGRNIGDLLKIRNHFTEHGINVIFTCTGEYVSDGSIMSNFVENMLVAIAEMEADTVADRIGPGKKAHRESKQHTAPLSFLFRRGSKVLGEKKFMLKDENVAPLVQSLFEEYIKNGKVRKNSNKEVKDILDEINEKYWDKEKSNNKKGYETCVPLIKQASLAGIQTIEYGKKIEDTFVYDENSERYKVDESMYQASVDVQPAISEKLWYEAIAIWKNNNTPKFKPSETFLFKGLIFCGKCNSKILFKNDLYYCKYHKTITASKDVVLKEIVSKVIDDVVNKKSIQTYIHETTKKLEKKKRETDELLRRNKEDQKRKLKYIVENNINIEDNTTLKDLVKKQKGLTRDRYSQMEILEVLSAGDELARMILGNKEKAKEIFLSNIENTQHLLISIIEKVVISGKDKPKYSYNEHGEGNWILEGVLGEAGG